MDFGHRSRLPRIASPKTTIGKQVFESSFNFFHDEVYSFVMRFFMEWHRKRPSGVKTEIYLPEMVLL
jgi:hypothetical protein